MRKRMTFSLALAATVAISPAFAATFQHTASDVWIAKWFAMENVMNNGGFAVSGGIDYFAEGTGGDLTYEFVSTTKGLGDLSRAEISLDDAHAGLGMGEDGVRDWEVVEIDTDGQAFDPNLHEAMVQMPSAEHPPGTVIQEMEKGYMLNDRVVRPARVIVSTAAIENEAGEGDTGGIDSDGTDSGDQQDDGKA